MAGVQDAGEQFPGLKQVPEVGPAVPLADRTRAVRVKRAGVGSILGVADIDTSLAGKQRPVAGIAGGQDAIHHIDAQGHVLGELVGHSDAHDVARLFNWQVRLGGGDHVEGQRARLADRQSTDGVPGQVERDQFARALGVPAIFGAVVYRVDADRERWFNTALSTGAHGEVTSRYDKEYLLAFGEYLPFGDWIPQLYEWSPNSGRFSPGTDLAPMLVPVRGTTHKISALICYEDILPAFTNKVVRAASPELLVNMTNDAWFGDTSEPWEHLALAQLRAIEHRRYLVRSTNSGVSAFIDPVGRVMLHTNTFQLQSLDAIVHFLHGDGSGTVYEALGDVPWWALSGLLFLGAFLRRPRAGD